MRKKRRRVASRATFVLHAMYSKLQLLFVADRSFDPAAAAAAAAAITTSAV